MDNAMTEPQPPGHRPACHMTAAAASHPRRSHVAVPHATTCTEAMRGRRKSGQNGRGVGPFGRYAREACCGGPCSP